MHTTGARHEEKLHYALLAPRVTKTHCNMRCHMFALVAIGFKQTENVH